MNLKCLFLRFSFVFILFTFSAFSNENIAVFQNSTLNEDEFSKEKIYLHFDKTHYNSGEDIWYKVYLVDANTHKPEALSKIVYVDLISPNKDIIISKIIRIDQGCGEGDFKLPTDLIHGQYTVRAYTNFMRNFDSAYFFRKKIHINSIKNIETQKGISKRKKNVDSESNNEITNLKPDVQFFPEGGYMVNDFINRIGFKAVGVNGVGIEITGSVIDEEGKKIKKFKTLKFGLGVFSFIPKQGKSYKVTINYKGNEVRYNLPDAKSKGVIMRVLDYRDHYKINIQSSLNEGVKNLELIGKNNDDVVCRARIAKTKRNTLINVSKNTLKQGIVQFTVFDADGFALCERLVFVEDKIDEPKVSIKSSKKKYGKRELVELDIFMNSKNEKNLQANMSIAITDLSIAKKDSLTFDIRSYLLLNSELKGKIEQPNYYFNSENSQRKKILDLLMMTQGWRQYVNIIKDSLEKNKYVIETGFSFKGNIKKFFNHKKTAVAQVSLMLQGQGEFAMDEIVTNDQGYFEFGDYDLNDSTEIIIQAKSIKTRKGNLSGNQKMNYHIELDTLILPTVSINTTYTDFKNENNSNPSYKKLKPAEQVNSKFDISGNRVKLDEVKLTAVGVGLEKYDKYINRKQLYSSPSQRVDFAELGKLTTGNVLQNLDGRIAGLSIKYFPNKNDLLAYFNRTQGFPLYLLNGIPLMFVPKIKTNI